MDEQTKMLEEKFNNESKSVKDLLQVQQGIL